jgi:hypothetical protein
LGDFRFALRQTEVVGRRSSPLPAQGFATRK